MTRPTRPARAIPPATLSTALSAAVLAAALAAPLAATSARAADPLVVAVQPGAPGVVYVPVATVPRDPADGEPLLPLAVLSGPGYGLTGHEYYFDERSEHPLRAPRPYRRAAYR